MTTSSCLATSTASTEAFAISPVLAPSRHVKNASTRVPTAAPPLANAAVSVAVQAMGSDGLVVGADRHDHFGGNDARHGIEMPPRTDQRPERCVVVVFDLDIKFGQRRSEVVEDVGKGRVHGVVDHHPNATTTLSRCSFMASPARDC